MKSRSWRCLPFMLLLFLFVQVAPAARRNSMTVDEPLHIASGYACLLTGDYRLVEEHPPLTKMLQAAPLLLADPPLPDPRSLPGWQEADLMVTAKSQIIPYRPLDTLLFAARIPTLWVALLLAALIYRWTKELFGPRAGLLALFLTAFDPNLLAHAGLATTDLGATAGILAASYAFWHWLRNPAGPAWRRSLPAGFLLGLALGTKSTAMLLIPILGLSLLFLRTSGSPLRRYWGQALAAITVAFLVLWGLYRFQVGIPPELTFPIPAPDHFRPLLKLQDHLQVGHAAFLLGKNYHDGDWRYFPVTFLLKTPPLTLLLLAGTAVALALRRLRTPGWRDEILLLAFPVVYFASSVTSSINIGYRHLLPILPFLFIWSSRIAAIRWAALPRWIARAALAGYAVVTLLLFPWHLTYFNILAGGPEGGYRYLVDSNLDWGQTLGELKTWMAEHGEPSIYYAHYSLTDPQAYGISAEFLPPDFRAVAPFAPWAPAPGLYAVGATVLQGSYVPDANTFAWFRNQEPIARLGHALFIYRVAAPPAPVHWVARCSEAVPLQALHHIPTMLGQPELRVLTPDCTRGWAYPAGAATASGYYFLPPGAPSPPGARLEFNLSSLEGELWPVYRVTVPSLPIDPGIAVTGPLHYAGSRPAPLPGDHIWTYWQVREPSGRPLSLMAHRIGPPGSTPGIDDGLCLPQDQWQPGDWLLQRHRFPADGTDSSGTIVTGGYWLDTMERWPVRFPDGTVGDAIPIR